MSQKIIENKDTSGVMDLRSDKLVENVRQFQKSCYEVPVLSRSGYIHIKAVMVGVRVL